MSDRNRGRPANKPLSWCSRQRFGCNCHCGFYCKCTEPESRELGNCSSRSYDNLRKLGGLSNRRKSVCEVGKPVGNRYRGGAASRPSLYLVRGVEGHDVLRMARKRAWDIPLRVFTVSRTFLRWLVLSCRKPVRPMRSGTRLFGNYRIRGCNCHVGCGAPTPARQRELETRISFQTCGRLLGVQPSLSFVCGFRNHSTSTVCACMCADGVSSRDASIRSDCSSTKTGKKRRFAHSCLDNPQKYSHRSQRVARHIGCWWQWICNCVVGGFLAVAFGFGSHVGLDKSRGKEAARRTNA